VTRAEEVASPEAAPAPEAAVATAPAEEAPAADAPISEPAVPSEALPVAETPTDGNAKDDKKASATVEDGSLDETEDPNAPKRGERKRGIKRLVKKLTREDGTPASIGVLTPLDYTTLNFGDLSRKTIIKSVQRYGDFAIRSVPHELTALTLEEFRQVILKHKLDIVIVVVLKPTNFDLFMFDKRHPYQIYAHSEVLSEAVQYQLTEKVVEEYTKVIIRRTLYAFMQDQYFDLPREEATLLAQSEVPRWIAGSLSVASVNREITSRFYGSASVGAALAMGNDSRAWNSNMIALQAGFRLFDKFYFETAIDMFAYNAFVASLKYITLSKETPFRFSFGIGGGTTFNKHTLNYDQNFTQGEGGKYIVPSVAMLIPIVDIHFKVETRLYVGLGGQRYIFAIAPGLAFFF